MYTDTIAQDFAREVRHQLGDRVREIRLFGSRARGDAGRNSDYDMLVIVERRTPEIRSIVLEIEVGLLDRYDSLVASVIRSSDEWENLQGYPLAINIAREGVVL